MKHTFLSFAGPDNTGASAGYLTEEVRNDG